MLAQRCVVVVSHGSKDFENDYTQPATQAITHGLKAVSQTTVPWAMSRNTDLILSHGTYISPNYPATHSAVIRVHHLLFRDPTPTHVHLKRIAGCKSESQLLLIPILNKKEAHFLSFPFPVVEI